MGTFFTVLAKKKPKEAEDGQDIYIYIYNTEMDQSREVKDFPLPQACFNSSNP